MTSFDPAAAAVRRRRWRRRRLGPLTRTAASPSPWLAPRAPPSPLRWRVRPPRVHRPAPSQPVPQRASSCAPLRNHNQATRQSAADTPRTPVASCATPRHVLTCSLGSSRGLDLVPLLLLLLSEQSQSLPLLCLPLLHRRLVVHTRPRRSRHCTTTTTTTTTHTTDTARSPMHGSAPTPTLTTARCKGEFDALTYDATSPSPSSRTICSVGGRLRCQDLGKWYERPSGHTNGVTVSASSVAPATASDQ